MFVSVDAVFNNTGNVFTKSLGYLNTLRAVHPKRMLFMNGISTNNDE